MKLLICFLFMMLLSGCIGIPYSSSTYRYFSPIRKKVGGSNSESTIRAAILEVIPLGTPRQAAEQLVRENFRSPIVPTSDRDERIYGTPPGWSSFRLHVYTHGYFPIGGYECDARFRFDGSHKLRDVIVHESSGFL